MFDSIFGLEDLPKQVERVLLMAERFPLALLAIVELTEVCFLPDLNAFIILPLALMIESTANP